jgi:hypothetical protein
MGNCHSLVVDYNNMKISPVDNTDAIIATAQALKSIERQQRANEVNRQLERNYEYMVDLRLSRRREELILDQLYFQRSIQKSRMIKGSYLDIYA